MNNDPYYPQKWQSAQGTWNWWVRARDGRVIDGTQFPARSRDRAHALARALNEAYAAGLAAAQASHAAPIDPPAL